MIVLILFLMPQLRIVFLILMVAGAWFAGPALALGDLDGQLMEAVQEGSPARVKALIAKGANVKAKDDSGSTALHYAARKDIAAMLISAGAEVGARDDDFQMTPLFNAPAEVASLLIEKGADVNARAKKGMTPLEWAVYWDQKDKIELLISRGANVNAKDEDGKTPLHVAANWDKKAISALLINKGADVNAGDTSCWTPLHWAAFEASVGTMDLLQSAGADCNAASCPSRGSTGPSQTPLDVASKYRSPDVVAYLKSKGCRSAAP